MMKKALCRCGRLFKITNKCAGFKPSEVFLRTTGLGASHQTGWTGVIATLLDLFGRLTPKAILESDEGQLAGRIAKESAKGK